MFNHELYAASLARAVDLLRQKDAREQQKSALRTVVTLSAAGSATIRCYDGQLSVDDVQIDTNVPNTGVLSGRMAAHNIAEIAIGRGAEAAELLALLRGLAEGPYGVPQVKDRLREVRSTRIWVLLANDDDQRRSSGSRRDSVSQLFEHQDESAVPGRPATKGGPKDEAAEALAMWDAMHSASGGNPTMKEVDLGFTDEQPVAEAPAEPASAPASEPEPEPLPRIPVSADTPMGRALLELARRPHDGSVLDRLVVLSEAVQRALADDQVHDVLLVLAMVAQFEAGAADGTPRNSYRITMRRILTRETLVQIAPYTADPRLAEDAARVLALASTEATDVLLGLLAASESIRERKAYMMALRAMPQGREQIPVMLGHAQWFVARNVAELAGEMRLVEATEGLTTLLAHADARVRRTAAMSLAKIGTEAALEPLRVALKDGPPDLRAGIASMVGSAQAPTLAAQLVVQLDTEEDPDTIKEICGALARIGSAETVQALERAMKQGGLFSRRGKLVRDAATEARKKVRKSG